MITYIRIISFDSNSLLARFLNSAPKNLIINFRNIYHTAHNIKQKNLMVRSNFVFEKFNVKVIASTEGQIIDFVSYLGCLSKKI